MVLVQKQPFFQFFFLGIIRQQNVFYDILERKNAFSGYKNKKSKMSRNQPKVLVRKWPFFQLFFLGTIGQENVFYDILKRKYTFLGYKNKSSKSREIDIFPKWITLFLVQKWPSFQNFLSRLYRPGKCLLRYSKTKKRLSRL